MDQNQSSETVVSKAKTKRILKWSLIIAIIIVLNLLFNYTTSLLYKAPVYENFCTAQITDTSYTSKDECVNAGGMWNESTTPGVPIDVNSSVSSINSVLTQPQVNGYCDPTYTCQNQYQTAQSMYDRNVFIVLIIAGVISIAIGVWLSAISVVSIGFSLGGVLSLIIGSMRYWSDMQSWLRVAVLVVALVVLIWIGIKKVKE